MAKPLLDVQQVCNRGPCPEVPRVTAGRTTSGAVVLGWYASPWQQVQKTQTCNQSADSLLSSEKLMSLFFGADLYYVINLWSFSVKLEI